MGLFHSQFQLKALAIHLFPIIFAACAAPVLPVLMATTAPIDATVSPTATHIPVPTATLTSVPSATNYPYPTLTPMPESAEDAGDTGETVAPRAMLLAQPNQRIQLFNQTWNYSGDNWWESGACINFIYSAAIRIGLKQCFGFIDGDSFTGNSSPSGVEYFIYRSSYEDIIAVFDQAGLTALTPQNTFGDAGQVELAAVVEESLIRSYEMITTDEYFYFVEMFVLSEDLGVLRSSFESDLQFFYTSSTTNFANTIDFVLADMLQKTNMIPGPTPTPLSAVQQSSYDALSHKLISEEQAKGIYIGSCESMPRPCPLPGMSGGETTFLGTWGLIADTVDEERGWVCRQFEDRTNGDVPWIKFTNCINRIENLPFEDIVGLYSDNAMQLDSQYEYFDNFALWGFDRGTVFYNAWLQDGEYLYYVEIASRDFLVGLQGPSYGVEGMFNQTVDDFLHNVLMVNIWQ